MADAVALETQKLDQLVHKTQQKILSIKSVFPFDLFPDVINVDENKVEVIRRHFFSEEIFPILIKNITGVVVTSNPIFATLKIEIFGFETNPEMITLLRHNEAIRAKRIIMGLTSAHKENIDLSQIPYDQVVAKVEEIGKAHEHNKI